MDGREGVVGEGVDVLCNEAFEGVLKQTDYMNVTRAEFQTMT